MTDLTTASRLGGKTVKQVMFAVTKRGVLFVNKTQFERFRRHGVPVDQMRIMEEVPRK